MCGIPGIPRKSGLRWGAALVIHSMQSFETALPQAEWAHNSQGQRTVRDNVRGMSSLWEEKFTYEANPMEHIYTEKMFLHETNGHVYAYGREYKETHQLA